MTPTSYDPDAVGRRVRRTFAFVDLSGFTSLTEREGDEEAVRVLTVFRNAVRSVAGFNGVRVAKWLGDGAMLVSTETRPMVEAILEIEHRLDADGAGVREQVLVHRHHRAARGEVTALDARPGDHHLAQLIHPRSARSDLGRDLPLMCGLVSQHRLADHVADLGFTVAEASSAPTAARTDHAAAWTRAASC